MPPPQANVYAEAPGQSCRGCSEKPRPALLLIKMGIPLTDLPECDSIQAWKTPRILSPGGDLPPDRQQRLQHLLRAGADLAFMWENDVLMVNRHAQPLWRNGGPPQQPSISEGK